jgi:hypothetical protein
MVNHERHQGYVHFELAVSAVGFENRDHALELNHALGQLASDVLGLWRNNSGWRIGSLHTTKSSTANKNAMRMVEVFTVLRKVSKCLK